MSSLGKCMVKSCENEATRASVALLPDKLVVPVVVCLEHYAEGTANYEKIYPKAPKREGKSK